MVVPAAIVLLLSYDNIPRVRCSPVHCLCAFASFSIFVSLGGTWFLSNCSPGVELINCHEDPVCPFTNAGKPLTRAHCDAILSPLPHRPPSILKLPLDSFGHAHQSSSSSRNPRRASRLRRHGKADEVETLVFQLGGLDRVPQPPADTPAALRVGGKDPANLDLIIDDRAAQ